MEATADKARLGRRDQFPAGLFAPLDPRQPRRHTITIRIPVVLDTNGIVIPLVSHVKHDLRAATALASPSGSSSTSSSRSRSSAAAPAASPTTPARQPPPVAAATGESPPTLPSSCACSSWAPTTSCSTLNCPTSPWTAASPTPCGGQTAGPSPVDRAKQDGKRSVAVHAWANNHGKLRWCTERRQRVVDFWLALTLAITLGQLTCHYHAHAPWVGRGPREHRTSPATGSPSSCERQGRTAVSPPSRTTTRARIGHRYPPTAGPGRTNNTAADLHLSRSEAVLCWWWLVAPTGFEPALPP